MYDFDSQIDRRNTPSTKWAFPSAVLPYPVSEAPLPMWIADMDFQSPPCVKEALHEAVEFGLFGYINITEKLLDSVVNWQKTQHNWSIKPEWISFQHSVVTAIGLTIQCFSEPGDAVLIQPPVYGPFRNSAFANGRQVVEAPLLEKEGVYSFDAEAFEAAITKNTKIFILCNPHNPVGKIWTREELKAMGEICLKHNILVLADEIHQDFILSPTKEHVSFASVSEELANNSITCVSPSKTFNLASLQTAIAITPNPVIREKLAQHCAKLDLMKTNILGLVACQAAYTHGKEWLGELKDYLRQNRQLVEQYINQTNGAKIIATDALYVAWIDFRETGLKGIELQKHLLTKAGIWLDDGLKFGLSGDGFARLNFACPRATLIEGLEKIKSSFK